MGYESVNDYLEGARNFLQNPPSGIEYFKDSSGWYYQYDPATNTFGIINPYGGVSTYFKPDTGLAYWLEQISKYKP